MTKVIVFANQKGGVAKTTSAIALAQALALVGKCIIFLDLDPHENASNTLRLNDVHPSLYDLITADEDDKTILSRRLQKVEGCQYISAVRGDLAYLRLTCNSTVRDVNSSSGSSLRTTRGFDAIIMDTPPTLGILTVNALTSADTVIVPVGPDP